MNTRDQTIDANNKQGYMQKNKKCKNINSKTFSVLTSMRNVLK